MLHGAPRIRIPAASRGTRTTPSAFDQPRSTSGNSAVFGAKSPPAGKKDHMAATEKQGAGIRFENARVEYPNGHVGLDDITLDIQPGDMVGVVGLSGAGKSTLIRTINGLVPLTGGTIKVGGRQVRGMGPKQLRGLRSDVGMIFQSFNLAGRTTVLNNVLMGRLHQTGALRSLLAAWKKDDVEIAMEALERVEIVDRAYRRASELSGGQQQRVAIARCLAQRPKVILADEPVASLDPPT